MQILGPQRLPLYSNFFELLKKTTTYTVPDFGVLGFVNLKLFYLYIFNKANAFFCPRFVLTYMYLWLTQLTITIWIAICIYVLYTIWTFLMTCVRFISYSKCSKWRRISKLLSKCGCLFSFCYLDWANSIKTDLHICSLWTGQFVSYRSVI